MNSEPPYHLPARDEMPADRRAASRRRSALGSLRWVRRLMKQPLGLQRRGLQWHVVLIERRRTPAGDPAAGATPHHADGREFPHAQPPARSGPDTRPLVFIDRRAGPGSRATGSLRWIKQLIARPVRLERSGRRFHVVLVERRQAMSVAMLVADLGRRLRGLDLDDLARVNDALARKGWSGVEALSSRVIGNALQQAETLADREPAPSLHAAIDRLSALRVTADQRADRKLQQVKQEAEAIVVSEATHEEFEAMSRSWSDSMAAPPAPDTDRDR